MRVLISAYAFNPSSSAHLHPGEDLFGWKMVEQISRRHQIWVITEAYNQDSVLEALSLSNRQNISIIFVQLPLNLRKIFYKVGIGQRIYYYIWQFLAWRKATRLHRKHHFDLAHHLTFGNYWIPSFIGAFLPVPFLWGPVGGGQKTPPPLMREFSLVGKISEYSRLAAQWISRQQFIWHRCLRRASLILVCNRETKQKIPLKYQAKVRYFPVNGIDSQLVNQNLPKKKDRPPFVIMMAGRLHRLKGFSLGLRACSDFVQTHPQSKLIVVGKGPERARLEKLANDLGIRSKVEFLPWLRREELLVKMKEIDVFLFPSFRDGGGAVVIEAMACGCPVIGLNVGGPGFHIEKDWGVKIEVGPSPVIVKEISEALEKLFEDTFYREKLGQAARQRVVEIYTWEKLGLKMEDLYRECLNQGKRLERQREDVVNHD